MIFNVAAIITLLLFAKESSSFYPKFDNDWLCDWLEEDHKSGWSSGYSFKYFSKTFFSLLG